MNPADLTLPATSPTVTNKSVSLLTAGQKNGKAPAPRVDLESIYIPLRSVLGDNWNNYKTAINAFILGNLNQSELDWVLYPLLSQPLTTSSANESSKPLSSSLPLHNALLVALYANILRDAPPSEIAPWVAATDKPSSTSKTAGTGGVNDQAEERLKHETMALHARDRRRIKTIKEPGSAVSDGLREMQDYNEELSVKALDSSSQLGTLTKSSWDLESRRRYAQPLAAETLEFPTQSDVQNRIEPSCNEEGLIAGAQATIQACAELVEQATEVFLKEMLGHLYSHARSDGEGLVNTTKFRFQFHKEEEEAERGIVQRNAAGLLPVEVDIHAKREPMCMADLQLALQLRDPYLRQDPFLAAKALLNQFPGSITAASSAHGLVNGGVLTKMEHEDSADAMAVDDEDFWTGSADLDRNNLLTTLDECLAVG